MKCSWNRATIKVSKCARVDGGSGETWAGRNLGKEELGFKRAQRRTKIQRVAGKMVSVFIGEKGKRKEYRGTQITL